MKLKIPKLLLIQFKIKILSLQLSSFQSKRQKLLNQLSLPQSQLLQKVYCAQSKPTLFQEPLTLEMSGLQAHMPTSKSLRPLGPYQERSGIQLKCLRPSRRNYKQLNKNIKKNNLLSKRSYWCRNLLNWKIK